MLMLLDVKDTRTDVEECLERQLSYSGLAVAGDDDDFG